MFVRILVWVCIPKKGQKTIVLPLLLVLFPLFILRIPRSSNLDADGFLTAATFIKNRLFHQTQDAFCVCVKIQCKIQVQRWKQKNSVSFCSLWFSFFIISDAHKLKWKKWNRTKNIPSTFSSCVLCKLEKQRWAHAHQVPNRFRCFCSCPCHRLLLAHFCSLLSAFHTQFRVSIAA